MTERVGYDSKEGVATITLDDGKVNVMSSAMLADIGMALDRAGLDPALASGTFVTTVTDVVGFFAFLGLAAMWLL